MKRQRGRTNRDLNNFEVASLFHEYLSITSYLQGDILNLKWLIWLKYCYDIRRHFCYEVIKTLLWVTKSIRISSLFG